MHALYACCARAWVFVESVCFWKLVRALSKLCARTELFLCVYFHFRKCVPVIAMRGLFWCMRTLSPGCAYTSKNCFQVNKKHYLSRPDSNRFVEETSSWGYGNYAIWIRRLRLCHLDHNHVSCCECRTAAIPNILAICTRLHVSPLFLPWKNPCVSANAVRTIISSAYYVPLKELTVETASILPARGKIHILRIDTFLFPQVCHNVVQSTHGLLSVPCHDRCTLAYM